MHLCQRLLLTAFLMIWVDSLASEAIGQPTELAHRYLNSRPDLYSAGLLVAIGIVDPPRTAITAEEFEAGIVSAAKMLNPANDWNATHPRWQRVVQQIRADAPRLEKALKDDPRWRYDPSSEDIWHETFAQTLTHELTGSDLRAIVDFYESPLGKRFEEATKRIYGLAAQQKARVLISRAKGEPYDLSVLAGFDLEKCEICTAFVDRESLGVATGFPLPVFNYKELAKVWEQLLSEEDRQVIQAFRLSEVAEQERRAMHKASFAIRATASLKEFVRIRHEAYEEIATPYLKSWRELMQESGTAMSVP